MSPQNARGLKIAVTGASGFIGTALSDYLRSCGHSVHPLVRPSSAAGGASSDGSIKWDPAGRIIDRESLEGVDAVINLAGESIAQGRWTGLKKVRILSSRVDGTAFLCQALSSLNKKPSVLLSGSAIGFYGHRGDETLTEASAAGDGFLADVCKQWEAATKDAKDAGIRVVYGRIGVVLGKGGGAMSKMLPLFQSGLGGPLGTGSQYWSWIGLHDLCRASEFVLSNASIAGPVNLVAPNPVTNKEFTAELAAQLHRPAFLPAPSFALKIALGDMADEMLLASQKVLPAVLQSNKFAFEHAQLKSALSALLSLA